MGHFGWQRSSVIEFSCPETVNNIGGWREDKQCKEKSMFKKTNSCQIMSIEVSQKNICVTLLTDIRSKELTNGESCPSAGQQVFWLWAGGSSINRVSVQDLQMKSETFDLVYRVGED